MHYDNVGLQWRHVTMNNNAWRRRWLLSGSKCSCCKPRFANWGLLILPTYDFNLNGMQSTAILITCQSQSMAPKCPAPKGPKLIQGYTPLIGPEAWLSTMGERRMFSTSTFVFYPLPHPQICTSASYHHPWTRHIFTMNFRNSAKWMTSNEEPWRV